MVEVIEASIRNIPPSQRNVLLVFSITIPVACFTYILTQFLQSGNPDVLCIGVPLIIGILSPIIFMSEVIWKESISITNEEVIYRKRSNTISVPYRTIQTVVHVHITKRYGIDGGDRNILMIFGETSGDQIGCGDFYSDADRDYLLEVLQEYQPYFGYEIRITEDPSEMFSIVRDLYGD